MTTTRNSRDTVLAEVEHMLGFGERPNRIAAALGIKEGSVAKSLWRSGRPDLAAKFEKARPERNHPCTDCGSLVSDPRAPRCRPCGYVAREANKRNGRCAA